VFERLHMPFERLQMPSLDGAVEWLNSEPLGPAELRGRIVLVNFWTLTCINWLRQEPYVRAWSQAYRDDRLVVIGVHTPEFSFEHEIDGVRHATKERAIDYPVAVDNDYEIWRAFGNHYWPGADCDVLVFGHTHKPWVREYGGVLFVNCGSVGKPKDGDPRGGFSVLDSRNGELQSRSGGFEYPAEEVAEEMRQVGLPEELSEKLVAAA
jgi:diadenosine tetraphosphatase ApaH/serine/threonine PP2A family protein phosphatase